MKEHLSYPANLRRRRLFLAIITVLALTMIAISFGLRRWGATIVESTLEKTRFDSEIEEVDLEIAKIENIRPRDRTAKMIGDLDKLNAQKVPLEKMRRDLKRGFSVETRHGRIDIYVRDPQDIKPHQRAHLMRVMRELSTNREDDITVYTGFTHELIREIRKACPGAEFR